jgi:non-ribosomal peptide synthetase component F
MNRLQLRALDCKLANEKVYWLEKLSGEVVASGIPLDFKRPKFLSERNEAVDFKLDGQIADRLLKVSAGTDTLAFTVLVAALEVCLSRYTGMEEITIGTTIHERFKEIASINKVLVLRDCVKESATLRQLLLGTRHTLAQAYANQKYPFERIIDLLRVDDPPNRAPLFDVAITLASINDGENIKHLKHDVSLSFAISDGEIKGVAGYYGELFKAETIDTFIKHYEEVLQTILYHPDKQVSETGLYIRRVSAVDGLTERSKDASEKEHSIGLSRIERADRSKGLALSYAQQRLWFLHQLRPSSPAYNVSSAVRLSGSLVIPALELAINHLIKRHEVLRTTFSTEAGKPVQVINPFTPLKLEVEDLTATPIGDRQQQARQRMKQEARGAFDLRRGPVMRARLLKMGEGEHVLMIVMHHIVFDSWSRGVLVREMCENYDRNVRGGGEQVEEMEEVEEMEIQYADYAAWERGWVEGEEVEEQMRYWRRQLSGEMEKMELGRRGVRAGGARAGVAVEEEEGGRERFEIGEELSEKVREVSREEGVTEYMVMLAGFNALLYRYSGAEEVVVGTPVANRRRREVEGMIGYFANTVVVRVDVRGEPSMREVVRRVKEVVVGANGNQEVPFERVVEEMRPTSAFTHSPFFNVLFNFEDEFIAPINCADLTISLLDFESDSIIHDLTLRIMSKQEGLTGAIEYNPDLFDRASIVRMIEHFKVILREAATYPDTSLIDISLVDDDPSAPFEMLRPIQVGDDVEQFDF